jgi:hypothetical protein
VSAILAVSETTVMSHMRAIVAASPMQSPLIAQMMGCSHRRMLSRRWLASSFVGGRLHEDTKL